MRLQSQAHSPFTQMDLLQSVLPIRWHEGEQQTFAGVPPLEHEFWKILVSRIEKWERGVGELCQRKIWVFDSRVLGRIIAILLAFPCIL